MINKYYTTILLTLFSILIASTSLWAATSETQIELTAEEKAWVQKHKTINVAAIDSFPPFQHTETDGEWTGIAIDILKLVAERCGFELKPTLGTWPSGLAAVKDKHLDLLPEIVDTPSRREFLHFTKPYLSVPHVLVVKNTSPIRTSDDLKGKRLILEKGYYTVDFAKKSLPDTEIIEVPTVFDALVAVTTGEADVYLGNISLVSYAIEKNLITGLSTRPFNKLGSLKLSIGVRKDFAPMIPILEKGLASVSPAERRNIQSHYFHQTDEVSKKIKLTQEEKTWLNDRSSPIIVGAESDWPPFDFVNGGKATGYSNELIRLAAQKTGLPLKFVSGLTWHELVEQFKDGKIDVLPAVYSTPERRKEMELTDSYSTNPQVLIANTSQKSISSLKQLEGKTIAVLKESAISTLITKEHPTLNQIYVKNSLAALKAVASGEADVCIESLGAAAYMLKKNHLPTVRITNEVWFKSLDGSNLHMGVKKGQSILRNILQKGLDAISEKEKNTLRATWLKLSHKPSQIGIAQLTKAERTWIKEHPELLVATEPGWPPFEYRNSDGEYLGISTDIMRLVAQRTGLKLKPVFSTWGESLEGLKDKTLDLTAGLAKTKEREGYLLFSNPVYNANYAIYTQPKTKDINSIHDLNGKTVAVEGGYQWEDTFKNEYPNVNLLIQPNSLSCLQAVSLGKADAYVGMEAVGSYLMDENMLTNLKLIAYTDKKMELFMGVRNDYPILRDILNKGLKSISRKEFSAIKHEYVSQRSVYQEKNVANLNPEEQKWIAENPTIKVAATPDWPPFEFKDARGLHMGISADVIKLVAKRTGLNIEPVFGPWPELIDQLKAGELDLAPGLNKTLNREEFLTYTRPFFSSLDAIYTEEGVTDIRSIADLEDKTVALEDGYSWVEILQSSHPDVNIILFSNTLDCLKAVSTGQADAYVGSEPVSSYLMNANALTGLDLVGYTEHQRNLSMGARKNAPILRDILQKGLDTITPLDMLRIRGAYLIDLSDQEIEKVTLTEEERDWLRSMPKIRFSVNPNWQPIESINQDTLEYEGIVNDLFKLVTIRTGLDLELVPTKEWDESLKLFGDGKIDMLSVYNEDDALMDSMVMTSPLLALSNVVVVRQEAAFVHEVDGLKGQRIGVEADSLMYHHLQNDHVGTTLVPVKGDDLDGLNKVINGEIDAYVGTLERLGYLINQNGLYNLKVAVKIPHPQQFKSAIHKNLPPEALSVLNKGIASISQEEKDAIKRKWLSLRVENKVDWTLVWQIISGIVGVSSIILFVVIRSNRRLAREAAQLEKAQKLLQTSDRQHRTIFESSPMGMLHISSDGIVINCNEKFAGYMGSSRDILVGYNTLSGNNLEVCNCISEAIAGTPTIFEGEYTSVTGNKTMFLRMAFSPFYPDDSPTDIIATIEDISERRAMEVAILEARDRAEESAKAKSDFLANMSHEIRTPMNAILGMSHLALKTELTPKQIDYVSKISISAKGLLGIINDILDFSKIDAGKLEIESVEFHLSNVLDDLSNLISVKTQEKGIELIFNIDNDLPVGLVGDPLRLRQILLNLCGNAVKFTERGEIVISAQLLAQDKTGVLAKFSVRDTGLGLTEKQQGKLFQSFSQADTSTTRKYGGTGLGLTISKKLSELMGGEIGVDSVYGEGSTFWFTIRFDEHQNEKMPPPHYKELAADLQDKKILIVDDNETALQMMQGALESFGLNVTTASSAYQALDTLNSTPDGQQFPVIVMDWMMPGMNGIEASRKIRENPKLGEISIVIMVSAHDSEEVMHNAKNIGIEEFLIKPVKQSLLFSTIMKAFGYSVDNTESTRVEREFDPESMNKVRGASILLTEDNEINQQIAQELLEGAGISVDIANNGQEAVEMVALKPYDGILMDIQMPVMDGFTASRTIRAMDLFKELPIIAMTANVMVGDREKVLQGGMNDHIGKPINVEEMFTTMAKWIKPSNPLTMDDIPKTSKEEQTEALLPESLPGIDIKKGLAITQQNHKLYHKILFKFENNQGRFPTAFAEAIKEKDIEKAERLAHTLKGVAGNIGATKLQLSAQTLETACQEGKKFEEIEEELAQTTTYLEQVISSIEGLEYLQEEISPIEKAEFNSKKVTELIQELKEKLENYDSSASNVLEELKIQLKNDDREQLTEKIEEHLAQYMFDEALEYLEHTAEQMTK